MIDVVGLTARGWPDLSEPERALIAHAEVLLGGRRHLGLVPVHTRQAVRAWPSPLPEGLPDLLASVRGRRVVALASGDPLRSGIGSTLIDLLGPAEVRVHPAVSSVALARARMSWPAESCEVVTLVGRDVDRLRRFLAPGARLILLSGDATTPATVAGVLDEAGFGPSEVTVFGDLGGDTESRQSGRAAAWNGGSPQLNVVCVACRGDHRTQLLGCVPGLPDVAYEHDGQLTKRDVRASALAHLAPLPGHLLWDVGAGAGSVGIEWSRVHPRCRAVAIERDRERARRIARNAARLGVPELGLVIGSAPEALAGLEPPDAVFVGGGGTAATLRRCWEALRPGGRIVAHAVTVETEQALLEARRTWGGDLTRIAVETLEPIGGYSGWTPARPVVQWSARKDPA